MTKYRKLNKNKKQIYEERTFSDTCKTIFFTIFVFVVFLLMFSYADHVSQIREHMSRRKVKTLINDDFSVIRYSWKCQDNKCIKLLAYNEAETSLITCNMLCSTPPIWPKPRQIQITNKKSSVIDKRNVTFDFSNQGPAKIMLQNATNLFTKNLESLKTGNLTTSRIKLNVNIILQNYNITRLKLNTDESYHLIVRKDLQDVKVYISAQNFFGARHGLETLTQLIWYDEIIDELKILHDVDIKDAPQFSYRGVMIDTARNYFPVYKLKKIVDGMAMSKLNVLHLHLTDAQSFPIILPRLKELAEYGAYGPDMVYTPQDIKDLLHYGLVRGVRLLLEIDAPSHVNAGWNYAKELFQEDYVICGENDMFNGHLNPDNIEALNALELIYKDLLEFVEDDEIFHIGADEVNLDCWRNTEAARNKDLKLFWAEYTNKILNKLKIANRGKSPDHVIMWSSPLTESNYFKNLDANITVQFWLGRPHTFLTNGNSVIYSSVGHWYLDCGFGLWRPSMNRGSCDPYTPWQEFYKYTPWRQYGYRHLALGGEVCLWSEQVEVDDLETRVWPRSAAFAERVWSDPDNFDNYDVYTRLASFRERLVLRGIQAAAMWPRWCSQNLGDNIQERECDGHDKYKFIFSTSVGSK